MKLFTLFFIFFSLPLFASETYINILGGRNEGEHIFATGNMYPNLSGIRGGSRITYNRRFNYGGFGLGYINNRFFLQLNFRTTGWYINPGNSRDEDFVFPMVRGTDIMLGREQGSKISVKEGKYNDSAHVYSGTINFADGHTRSSLFDYSLSLQGRYYFGNASPSSREDTYFLSTGLNYSYFKYYLYDVIQYVGGRPPFLGPIGNGLSYTHSYTEIPVGIGYVYHFGNFQIEPHFEFFAVFNRFRDFHVQRALTFIGSEFGPGIRGRLSLSYFFSNRSVLKIGYYGHRQFTRGEFETNGGLSLDDVLSNFMGTYKSYINTKQQGVEISYSHKMF